MSEDSERFPIGRFRLEGESDPEQREQWIGDIETLPRRLREAVQGLPPERLDIPYREGGWTVRQVIHHLPDSHLNAYIRFKLALTEDAPTIKPYDEAAWAELPDNRLTPPEVSLSLLETLHRRWTDVLRSMQAADFARVYRHPEYDRLITLHEVTGLYSWHGRHHLAHITRLRERMGW